MKRILLITVVLTVCTIGSQTAQAQYYQGYGNSAFGDGVASTYGYGTTSYRARPWDYGNANVNLNFGVQQFNTYPRYRQPVHVPIYQPKLIYPNLNYRPLKRW